MNDCFFYYKTANNTPEFIQKLILWYKSVNFIHTTEIDMQSSATTVDEYMASLPEDRQAPMTHLRNVINANIPSEFSEGMGYGMMGWAVPHSLYPAGYHCDPKLPLPFLSVASQKNFIAVYHMGIYANPNLLEWFTQEYAKRVKGKLDMGKSCIRFKKMDQIPFDLIGELSAKVRANEWIEWYENELRQAQLNKK